MKQDANLNEQGRGTSCVWLQFKLLDSKFIDRKQSGGSGAGGGRCLTEAEFGKMKGSGTRREGYTILCALTVVMPHFTWLISLVGWVCPGFLAKSRAHIDSPEKLVMLFASKATA